MAKVLLKKSSVGDNAPATGDLSYGEVAINYADGRLYYKNSSNEIKNFIDSDVLDATYIRSVLDDPSPELSNNLEIHEHRITNDTYGPGSYIGLQEYYADDSDLFQQMVIASRQDVNVIINSNGGALDGNFYIRYGDSDVNNSPVVFKVDESGVISAYANINMVNGGRITGLGTPVAGQDAVNKTYVDDAIETGTAGIEFPFGDYGKVDSSANLDAFGISYTNSFWDMLSKPENSLPVVDLNT